MLTPYQKCDLSCQFASLRHHLNTFSWPILSHRTKQTGLKLMDWKFGISHVTFQNPMSPTHLFSPLQSFEFPPQSHILHTWLKKTSNTFSPKILLKSTSCLIPIVLNIVTNMLTSNSHYRRERKPHKEVEPKNKGGEQKPPHPLLNLSAHIPKIKRAGKALHNLHTLWPYYNQIPPAGTATVYICTHCKYTSGSVDVCQVTCSCIEFAYF